MITHNELVHFLSGPHGIVRVHRNYATRVMSVTSLCYSKYVGYTFSHHRTQYKSQYRNKERSRDYYATEMSSFIKF